MAVEAQGRPYDASNRRAEARRTRERILSAARELFLQHGFVGTSMADVAAAGGVSVPTVFSAFGTKTNLLKEAAETTIVGDAEQIPMAERPEMRHVHAGETATEILDRYADLVAARAPQVQPIYSVLDRSRDAHPEVAAMVDELDEQRLRGAAAVADRVVQRLGRADDETLRTELRDVIWATLAPAWYEALVLRRNWRIERYRDWVRAAMGIPLGG